MRPRVVKLGGCGLFGADVAGGGAFRVRDTFLYGHPVDSMWSNLLNDTHAVAVSNLPFKKISDRCKADMRVG